MTTNRSRFNKANDTVQIGDQYFRQMDNEGGQLSAESLESRKRCKNLAHVITSRLFVASVVLISVIITVVCISLLMSYEMSNDVVQSVDFHDVNLPEQQKEWFDLGIEELKAALSVRLNSKRAKNVILFVGDGMGPNTVTAARIYKGGEGHSLSWEKFPHMGLLKTYCTDKLVPDSMASATALFSGVKTNYHTGGVDSTVQEGNCTSSQQESSHVHSIIKWAQDDGMKTGFVTTTRVTHATPAALYAHVADRNWECENKIPEEMRANNCKDIARILVEDAPGKNINVIMGGGRQCLVSNVAGSEADPIDTWSCYSTDGRNLIADWEKEKQSRGVKYAVLSNSGDLDRLEKGQDYVLGVFANGHLKYEFERDKGPTGMPSLRDMTTKAIEILKSDVKGFLLVVEGGNIDQAHHRGAARKALVETVAMDDAVQGAIEAMRGNLDETLIIVTADHSHTLSINGYPERGSNILGVASKSKTEKTPYTILTYATSYQGFQVDTSNPAEPRRRDPSLEDTTSFEYTQQAAINTDENTHGGSDVLIHAMGPMAHLFHRIHEQSYVAHVISYVLRIGRFSESYVVESAAEMLRS